MATFNDFNKKNKQHSGFCKEELLPVTSKLFDFYLEFYYKQHNITKE